MGDGCSGEGDFDARGGARAGEKGKEKEQESGEDNGGDDRFLGSSRPRWGGGNQLREVLRQVRRTGKI